MCAVTGVGSDIELQERSPLGAALRAEVDFSEQVISPSERTTLDLEPVLPVAHTHGLVDVSRLDEVRGTDFLDLTVGPVRDALADKEFSPRRRGGATLQGPSVSW